MKDLKDCTRLTIMMRVADTARADIALTPERIYYRFATDDTIEDGELPAPKEEFGVLAESIVSDAEGKDGESPLGNDMKVEIYIDNRVSGIKVSEQSLRRLVNCLKSVAEEFAFLGGFC